MFILAGSITTLLMERQRSQRHGVILMEERQACRRLSDQLEAQVIKTSFEDSADLEMNTEATTEIRDIEVNGQNLLEIRVETVVAGKTIHFQRWVQP